MSDLHSRLARWRKKLAEATDPDEIADIQEMIASLEAQQRSHTQTLADEARVGIAIAGDVHGDVTHVAGDQRTVNTAGGDYAENNIDKRQGIFYEALVQIFYQATGTATPSNEQRELLVSYLKGLIVRCDRMRLTGIVDWERKHGKAPSFTLSQLYVALATTGWQTVAEADSADSFADALDAGSPDLVLPLEVRRISGSVDLEGMRAAPMLGNAEKPRIRLERPVLVTEALSRQRQMVLLGGPGSGKSTFLRHLAVALARAELRDGQMADLPGWEAGLVLPLYASLGAYAAWVQGTSDGLSLDGLWRFVLSQSEGVMLDGMAAQLKTAFRKRRLLLLLDGLDEVAEPAARAAVASVVAQLATQQGLVVVTCRIRSFEGAVATPFESWGEALQLAPFTLGQMRHFISGWYQRGLQQRALSAELAAQRVTELSGRIASTQQLRDLAEIPLLLTIMTILHYYDGTLPDDRADLYEDMTQLLLTRWTAQRREAGAAPSLLEQLRSREPRLSGLSDFQIRGVLEQLAYRAHQASRSPDGRGLLERGVVREAFLKLFANFGLDDAQDGAAGRCAALVLRYLEEESGLLLHEGGDMYGLPHLTYEEYLSACYLAKQKGKPDFRRLAYEHWRSDPGRWREVVFLALGRMLRGDDRDIAASWLDFLLFKRHGERIRDTVELQQAALFAGDCLLELGGLAKLSDATSIELPAFKQRLAQQLAELVEGTTVPAAERVRAGLHLGVVGDPRPGVCDLPPPMIALPTGEIVIGLLPEELEPFAQQFFDEYIQAGNTLSDDERHAIYNELKTWVNEQSSHVDSFELARYPVTNAQWALFMEASSYDPDQLWWDRAGREWLQHDKRTQPTFWEDARFGIVCPNHPVVGISWYEAMAFCRWLTQYLNDGYQYCLPSELEWEYAARGHERRVYAWGKSKPDGERANFEGMYDGSSAVGCFPLGATPHGLLDMSGTVWEWTGSAYRPYPYDPEDGREHEEQPADKSFTLRGGGWYYHPINLRASNRHFSTPDYRYDDIGMRLARHSPV